MHSKDKCAICGHLYEEHEDHFRPHARPTGNYMVCAVEGCECDDFEWPSLVHPRNDGPGFVMGSETRKIQEEPE